tara:strand:+ start:4673 stop:5122 length:450 start_codon:yes stop_codon:yes gene_type:complete
MFEEEMNRLRAKYAQMHRRPIFDNTGRKVIATFYYDPDEETGYVDKEVEQESHQLRMPPAWAMDIDVINQIKRHCTWDINMEGTRYKILFRIHARDTDSTYITDLTMWDKHGVEFDRGYGKQIYLPLKYWSGGLTRQDYNQHFQLNMFS